MDATLQGIFYLVAVVLFVVAALAAYAGNKLWPVLGMLGLAVAWSVAMVNAFDAA